MKTFLAYILSFFVGPFAGMIGFLVVTPVALSLGPIIGGVLMGAATTFVGCWVTTFIFAWLSVDASLLMYLPVWINCVFLFYYRMTTREPTPVDFWMFVGTILGVPIFAILLHP